GAPEVLPRLDAFLGQARQAEQQRKNGRMADVAPADLLSLAVSGWLVGTAAAEAKPATAIRLWRARQMVLAYTRAEGSAERQRLLETYQREVKYEATLEEFMQLIPQLPPP